MKVDQVVIEAEIKKVKGKGKLSPLEIVAVEEALFSIIHNHKAGKVKGVIVDVLSAVVILMISHSLTTTKKAIFLGLPIRKIIQITINQAEKLVKKIKKKK